MSGVTLPTQITLLRLAALPVILFAVHRGQALAAAILFVAAMLTDVLDGYLAKRLHQTSRLGMYLDPVVDKIVILALLYTLALGRVLHPAIAHLLLARELLHNGVRVVAAQQGRQVGANWMGKVKAVLQTVLVTWGLLLPWLSTSLPDRLFRLLEAALPYYAWGTVGVAWVFFGVFVAWNRTLLTGGGEKSYSTD